MTGVDKPRRGPSEVMKAMKKIRITERVRSNARARTSESRGQAGIGLVESMIGLLVFTILMLAAGQLMRVHIETLLMGERQRKAGKQAGAGLNNLVSKKRSELADGGAFAVDQSGIPTRNYDNTVTLNCSAAYCDQIIAVPQASGTGTDLITIGWGANLPNGSQTIYTRAWTVRTLDGAKGLRRVTIAVFPNSNDEPLSVLRTEAVQRN
jgi:Tfp pilus assembly protein PilV